MHVSKVLVHFYYVFVVWIDYKGDWLKIWALSLNVGLKWRRSPANPISIIWFIIIFFFHWALFGEEGVVIPKFVQLQKAAKCVNQKNIFAVVDNFTSA